MVIVPASNPNRVLLGQLGSGGDCLYTTALARQIKTNWPGCHLTWAVGSLFRPWIEHNPYVDSIWTVPLAERRDTFARWSMFEAEVVRQLDRGSFDLAVMSQICPGNYQRWDGTVRVSGLRAMPELSVPVTPVMRTTADERARVDTFARRLGLDGFRHRILMECQAYSLQSAVTPDTALRLARRVVERVPDTIVVLSLPTPLETGSDRVVVAHELSLRENHDLVDRMSLFVGCISGLSVVAMCEREHPVPMVQLVDRRASIYASVSLDFHHWGLATDQLVELRGPPEDEALACIETVLTAGMAAAKARFDRPLDIDFQMYFESIHFYLLQYGRFADAARSLLITAQRFGWHPQLRQIADQYILPRLKEDPLIDAPDNRALVERLRALLPPAGA
jgi:hypothetical protein